MLEEHHIHYLKAGAEMVLNPEHGMGTVVYIDTAKLFRNNTSTNIQNIYK